MPARCWIAPGDADRQVELRRHRLAGLAHLELVRVPAGVGGGARRADRRAQRVGQLLDQREVLRRSPRRGRRRPRSTPRSARGARRASATTRSVTCAVLAASLTSTLNGSTSAAPAAGSGAIEFGRTAMIGAPVRDLGLDDDRAAEDRLLGDQALARGRPTSVSSPEPVLIASRPAISRPSAVLGTRTAAGDGCRDQRGQQLGLGRHHVVVELGAVGDIDLGRAELGEPLPAAVDAGPAHTAAGSPSLRASVSSSAVTFLTVSPACSTRTRISAMSGSPSSASFVGQMNFCAARNSAAFTPPSPSSVHDRARPAGAAAWRS